MVGAVIGARLMHCFAYEPEFYLSHPLEILKVWKGGLASHGGLLGVLIALYVFSKKYNESYMWLISRVAMPGALTAAFVRFGNLFNSEILGLPTDKPWAIIFPRVDMIPRHPVQLYEAFAYLFLLFILVTIYKKVTTFICNQNSAGYIPDLYVHCPFSTRIHKNKTGRLYDISSFYYRANVISTIYYYWYLMDHLGYQKREIQLINHFFIQV